MIEFPKLTGIPAAVANRRAVCDALLKKAGSDSDIFVLCSDSRGSASMGPFFDAFPNRSIETGIAEQNLVGIAAGLARCGKKPFVFSPASFLSARSYEQIKVDCAYSHSNVKLVGISGGVSYGALGMTHHSLQDIAGISAIPGMRVYLPSDRFQTAFLIEELLKDDEPAYIRIGRNPVPDIYTAESVFCLDKAVVFSESPSADVAIIACGEMVFHALNAALLLKEKGVSARVVDMYCVKPLDRRTLLQACNGVRAVFTVEEHSPFGGLGSAVCQAICAEDPKKAVCLSLPDNPVVTGTSAQVFAYYKLDGGGIAERILDEI